MLSVSRIGVQVLVVVLALVSLAFGDNPKVQLDWYGFVKLDASYDQNPTSHGDFAMWVNPQSLDQSDAQFNMTHKATRFGVKMKNTSNESVIVGGNIELDMYGSGGTENKALLLLRHAYFTVQSGNLKLLAGQSWDLIAPLNPGTLNYPVLWGAGNIQYRRPQLSLFYTFKKTENSEWTWANGLFRTIGEDLTPTFALSAGETADGSDDGTDAAIPSIQSRIEVTKKSTSGSSLRAGVSGLWGQLKSETTLGNSEKYESWALSGHMMYSFGNGSGVSGEVYTGSNLGSYFGGILNGNRVNGLATMGGWMSAWTKLNSKVTVTGGFSYDNPDDADLSSGNRSQNQVLFANMKYNLVPAVTIGLEVSHWGTDYIDGNKAKATRVESSFIMNF